MKTKILLNRSGMSPDGTSRKGRYCLDPILSRLCLASLICVLMLTLGSGNVWGQAASQAPANGSTYVVTYYTNSKYYALPNSITGGGTLSGTQVTVNGSGQVTSDDPPTWTLEEGTGDNAGKYYLKFTSGGNTYYLYKNGTSSSNKKFAVGTTNKNYWTFATSGTGYTATAVNRGSNRTKIGYENNAFCCSGTAVVLRLLPVATSGPTLTTSSSMTTLTYSAGSPVAQSFTIGGSNLTSTVTVTAPTDYEVCKTSGGSYTSSVSFTNTEVNAADKTVYIRLQSGLSGGNISSRDITVASSGADSKTIAVTGSVPYTITWMANGNTHATTYVAVGSTLALPATDPVPNTCGCTGKAFYGWYGLGTSYSNASIAPTIATAGDAVSVDKTYYAVFADAEGGEPTPATLTFSYASHSGWSFGGSYSDMSTYYRLNSVSDNMGYVESPTISDMSTITSIDVYAAYYGGSGYGKFKVYGGNTQYGTEQSPSSNSRKQYTLSPVSNPLSGSGKIKIICSGTSYDSAKGTRLYDVTINYTTGGTTYSNYTTTCCTDPGLNYGTGSVTKTYGEGAFTKELTNSHSVAVTYSSSDPTVATVNGSGQVTILKAGSTTITASSIAQTVAAVSYCADEASYTLTVNKASISPTLTYDPAAVTVGSTLTSFTLSGNSGSGTVTYVSSNDAIATVNSSGVVTGVAPGTVTITATIAATTNYNGNTATSNTITVNAAACTGVNSLHTGNKDQGGWVTNQCFEDADWGAADDAIYVGAFPLTNECYVGWAGGNSYYGAYWAVGGIKTYDIPTGRTLGWNSGNYYESYPGGALGTFHIYKNSTDENYYLRFKPSSYILRTGSDGTSWTSREMTVSATNSHYYETSELDLTSTLISEHAYVDLKTSGGDGHVWCNFSNDRTASGNVKVKSSVGDADGNFRGDNLKASDNGTHGKFRIDITKDVDNWKLAFVPMYRITYAAGTGASGSMDPSSYAEISTTIAAAANGFTAPTGKQFNGWSDGVNSYAAGANVTMNSNVTLTAQWTDINYTVTVNQNPSVGATTTGQTTTAHYNGTINLTTTVPSGYRFVNWTTSDGFSITNSTSATTASFTMPNKNVTVTANFQQTHTVDWYVGGSAPANKIGDDGQTTVVDHGGKIEDFPATTPDGTPCDKTFVGWTNTTSYVHGTSPLFNDVAGSPTINADASFYAVFATGGTDYELVTSSSTALAAGDEIIFVSSATAGSAYAMGYQNTNNRPQVSVTIASGPKITSPTLATSTSDNTNIYPFILEANDGAFAIKENITGGRYLKADGAGSSGNNYLHSASETTPNTTTEKFTISIASSTSIATITGGNTANNARNVMQYNSGSSIFSCYASASQSSVYIYRKGYSGHTIICSDCGTSVTPTYTASPTGGTVSVTKSATPVTSGSTVKTCTAVDLTVTINPASHYTLTGFTATGLSTGTATISPVVAETLPKTTETTFTVTVSAGATGTLNLTPTFTEDAHKVISWVVHGSSASIADGHGTTWVYSGEDLTAIPTAPDAPTGCDDKVFVGWSENDGGATEEDASYYDDLFTTLVGAPTGITTDKTFTAVFATPAAGLGGTVMWDEPWTGASANDQPSGTTGYNSTSITYSYSADGCKIYEANLAGGTSPELLVKEKGESFTAANIPTAAQTALTLTYKSNKSLSISSGTSGVTVGDANVDGTTYTHTITISQSPAVNNFALTFTKTGSSNARIDDINIAVPGSSSMTGYVTTCEDTWTVTYYKNTEDAVTNLPSPTGISKSTGSGTLSSKVPVRYGYTFDGWAISAGGSVAYAAGAAVSSVSADMDLYAKWSVTPVTEINLSKTSLDKYVGDPSVILSVLSVLPDGANTSVTWSSSNPSVATVNSTTGEVNFVAEGTANIIATSTITSGITATCAVTVWAKPSVSFLDNLHSLTEDKDGNALSGYNITDVAGTPVVFPVLANQPAGSGTCEDEFYVFVGWTTSDNNTDPEDHLVTSHNLTNGDNITYYAVWANGVSGTTYTKLTSSTFKTSPTKYVLGAAHADSGTEHYFYSCDKTDKNNSWGYVTADLASNTPIEFTLSGTAAALVATSTEVSARYLKPLADKDFQMSASSQTVELKSDGTIYNNNTGDTSWRLLYNKAGGLRWYSSNVSGSTNAYFYEVVAGGEVNYRTSCCADKVAAPSVTATKTSTTVTLTWAAVSGATGYELQWNGGAWTAATSGVVKSDLTPNTNYSWRVRATYDPPKCGADIASGSTTTNQVYHVTYAKGSGTGSCNATGSTTDGTAYEAGATVTLQSNGFTLVGHTFNEWTEDDDDITISSNQFTMPEHDVVITATWTPKVDKFYDRMHDGTDASHGGIRDGDGKYYITREGCSYTVPSLTDNTSGATACHTKHYVLMGWTAENHLNSDGTLKTGHEGYVYTGGGTQTATGATYYAVWAEVEE